MAVKFEFVMDDIDAENLIRAIYNEALRNDEVMMEYKLREDLTQEQKNSYMSWLRANKEYTLGLMKKMTNKRMEE